MSDITTAYCVRRALTDAEMASITAAVDAARSATEIINAALHVLFTALLATLGQSLDAYGRDRRLDPGAFAIPQAQADAIGRACLAKADAYGARAQIVFELINLMPASYEDTAVAVVPAPIRDQRPYQHVLTVSREATDVITAASHHCRQIAAFFGEDSREHLEAVGTWQHNISRVFSMSFGAQTHITRDGDLSLLVRSGTGFTYAIIFHPQRRTCANDGCAAVINDDGTAWTYRPEDPTCPDGQHAPSYPLDAPCLGSWSFHS
jgi:hypothetical protein